MNHHMSEVTLQSTVLDFERESILLERRKSLPKPPTRPQRLQRIQRFRKWLLLETNPLEDHEALEMILNPFTCGRKTRLVARALLREFGTIRQVLDAAASDLIAVEGMEEAGVVALKATAAVAQHMIPKARLIGPSVRNWYDLSKYIVTLLQNWRSEGLLVIFVDYRGYVIEDNEIGSPIFDQRHVCAREVVRRCFELNAAGIVMVHDHPCGILISREDRAAAMNIAKAANSIGITIRDHVVMGPTQCFKVPEWDLF